MELDGLAKRINNSRRLEQLADRPSTPYDPSDGMETVAGLKDYVRFLYAMVQGKDKRNREMAEDIRPLREDAQKYSGLLEQLASTNDSLVASLAENRRLTDLVAKLTEQLAIARKERFAGKSQKSRKGKPSRSVDEKSRTEDKNDFDGGNSTKPTSEADSTEASESPTASPEEKHTTGTDANRKGTRYNTMKADEVVTHRSDESLIPEGCTFMFKRISRSFEQIMKVIGHDYEMVVHMDREGRMHEAYLPIEGEPVGIDKFPGTHASAGFLANIAFSKYVMCTPLYREMNRIVASKMSTCRQTLVNWIRKGAKYLDKLTEEFKNLPFADDAIVNADETWERLVLKEGKKGYVWCFVNRITRVVMFHYDKGSRSRASLKDFIGDRKIQALQSDGYNVYMYLDDEVVNADHLCCMAHARAKFKYALDQPKIPYTTMRIWLNKYKTLIIII